MITSGFENKAFALDVQGIQRLRYDAVRNPDANLRAAAEQFEALLLQTMLKSMRQAGPRSELFDSSQNRFYESLMDQQWAQHLAGQGLGLAEQLVAQLNGRAVMQGRTVTDSLIAGIPRGEPTDLRGREIPVEALVIREARPAGEDASSARTREAGPAPQAPAQQPEIQPEQASQGPAAIAAPPLDSGPDAFIAHLRQPAFAVAAQTGIPAELLLAQAALETGWGRYRIPTAEGDDSHNLFGIKAGGGWAGEVTSITTHEFIEGRRVPVRADFRVYDSYQEAFADYARLMRGNPRYAAVGDSDSAEQAARALQAAGYATDPAYADKLISLIERSRQLAERG